MRDPEIERLWWTYSDDFFAVPSLIWFEHWNIFDRPPFDCIITDNDITIMHWQTQTRCDTHSTKRRDAPQYAALLSISDLMGHSVNQQLCFSHHWVQIQMEKLKLWICFYPKLIGCLEWQKQKKAARKYLNLVNFTRSHELHSRGK